MLTEYDSLDDIPEHLQSEYEERDGAFHLSLEGKAPKGYASAEDLNSEKTRVGEFRTKTNDLLLGIASAIGVDAGTVQSIDPLVAHLAQFKGIDPVEHRRLAQLAADLEKKRVTKADDINTLVAEQVAEQVRIGLEPLQIQLRASEERESASTAKINAARLVDEIWSGIEPLNPRSGTKSFLVSEAAKSFELRDDVLTAKANILSVDRPGTELTLKEWAKGALKTFDYAFGETVGGGKPREIPSKGSGPSNVREVDTLSPNELGSPETYKLLREQKVKIVGGT